MSDYDDVRFALGQQGHFRDSVYRSAENLIAAGCDADSLMDAVISGDPEENLRALEVLYRFN